jgi:methylmalonyl-CoA mutase
MTEHSDIVKKIKEEFSSPPKKDWMLVAEQSLKGKPVEKISSLNYEGVNVQPIYSKEDIETLSQIINSTPGSFPFVRGKNFDGYKTKSWEISQPIIAKDSAEFNAKLKDYLSRGQTSVTCISNDYDNTITNFFPKNSTEFSKAFDGIDLKNVPINFFVGQNASKYLEIIDNYIENHNLSWSDIQGGLDFDPIADLVTKGNCNYPLESAFNDLKKHLRKMANSSFCPVSVSGLPYREGGADAVQELAFILATSVHYLRNLLNDFDIDYLVKKIRLVLSTGSDFFVEIAKIRAVRMLWAKIIKEFGGNLESQKANIYIKSLEMNKSSLDIYVNMLRNTTEALSSIIGGCDTLELLNFDSTVKNKKSEDLKDIIFSERVTRNTQLVLAEECLLKEVTDPAGGSYYIEYLTNEIAQKSWLLFQEIEKQGGIFESLKLGFPQNEVARTKALRIKNLATRKDVVLGANKYPNLSESQQITESPEPKSTAHNSQLITPIPKFRASEVFETLRMKAIEFQKKTGKTPKVYICAMGPLSKHKARVDFTTDFLHVGGIETEYNGGFSGYEDAAKAFLESGLNVVVFCSSDEIYTEFVPQLSRLIKKAKPFTKIILAGYPADKIEEYKNAGVDEFIHIKADIVKILQDIYNDLI